VKLKGQRNRRCRRSRSFARVLVELPAFVAAAQSCLTGEVLA
jgi:hypothetical protein